MIWDSSLCLYSDIQCSLSAKQQRAATYTRVSFKTQNLQPFFSKYQKNVKAKGTHLNNKLRPKRVNMTAM